MDPELNEAARDGDVEFLREAFSTQPAEYFLTQVSADDEDGKGENILHIAVWRDQLKFIKEAVKILPKDTLKQLLFQSSDASNRLPLHAAAVKSEVSYKMVLILKKLYSSFNLSGDGLVKPWLAVTHDKKMTALHLALNGDNENENCALEILKMDGELVSCTMVDSYGNTPLYYALKYGFNEVAEMILKSPLASSSSATLFRSSDKSTTPFKLATADDDYYSEVIVRLLFKNCGEWLDEKVDDNGSTIIHQWTQNEEARPFKILEKGDDLNEARTKVFKQKISEKDDDFDTPLHIVARYNKDSEIGMILLRGHQKQQQLKVENPEIGPMECPPWRIKNKDGNTPIHDALDEDSKHEDLALEMLAIDPSLSKILNNRGESLFFLAVNSGCARAVEAIMKIEEPSFQMLCRNDGTTVLHGLSSCPGIIL